MDSDRHTPRLHEECQVPARDPLRRARMRRSTRDARSSDGPAPTSELRKEPTLSKFLLKLYVTGQTPRAELAIANLRRICEEELQGKYDLQIIDVVENPQLAEDEKILATPTLIKRLPPPLRRVIGDLSDKEKVLLGLNVWPDVTPPENAQDGA